MFEALLLVIPAWGLLLTGIIFLALFFFIEFERPGWATISVILTIAVLQIGNIWDSGVNVIGLLIEHPFYALLAFCAWFVIGGFWSVGKWWFFVRRLRDKYEEKKRRFLLSHGIKDTLTIPDELKERFLYENYLHEYDRAINTLLRAFPDYSNAASRVNDRVGGGTDLTATATHFGVNEEALRDLATFTNARPDDRKDLLSLNLPDEMKAKFSAELSGPEMRAAIVPSARDHKWRIMTWMAWWPWSMLWTLLNDPIRRIWRWVWKNLQKTFASIATSAFRSVDDDLVSTHETPTKDLEA